MAIYATVMTSARWGMGTRVSPEWDEGDAMAIIVYAQRLSESPSQKCFDYLFSMDAFAVLTMSTVMVASNILLFVVKQMSQIWLITSMVRLDGLMMFLLWRYMHALTTTMTLRRHRLSGSLCRTAPTIVPSDCAICLEPMTGFVFKTSCGHKFHADCVENLSRTSMVCPLCRSDLRESVRYTIKEFLAEESESFSSNQ